MDRVIYLAMTGAKQVAEQQATTAHNLSNLNTTGFRAQLDSFRAMPVVGPSLPTRAYVLDATSGNDLSQGAMQETGRALDVAIRGSGWLVMQQADGSEVVTRDGRLKLNENGVLVGERDLALAGEAGPITAPPDARLSIAVDGTVSAIDVQGRATALGRLRLVDPPAQDLLRGEDGLFRTRSGEPAAPATTVQLHARMLEGSNVNAIDAMVSLIRQARSFELEMSVLKNAENNDTKASQILQMNG